MIPEENIKLAIARIINAKTTGDGKYLDQALDLLQPTYVLKCTFIGVDNPILIAESKDRNFLLEMEEIISKGRCLTWSYVTVNKG